MKKAVLLVVGMNVIFDIVTRKALKVRELNVVEYGTVILTLFSCRLS
jgi:hypothetical protein